MPFIQSVEVLPSLREIRRQLRALDVALPKELQRGHKRIAAAVAEQTRAQYLSVHQSRSGAGARSIRGLAAQTRAQVAMGGPRAPYVLGQNFGSKQGARKRQFPRRREPDYFLYTTIGRMSDEIGRRHGELVDELMRPVFPEGPA